MKIADGWLEITETYVVCPYCFRNIKIESERFYKEGDKIVCSGCSNEFELGEPA